MTNSNTQTNKILWSMYEVGHEDEELLAQFPHAVSHDAKNRVFVDIPEDTADAFFVPEVDENGDPLPLETLIVMVGGFLATDSTHALIATKQQLQTLFSTPHHRLWCAKYTDKDELEADYQTVFGEGVDNRKSIETLNSEARADILTMIQTMSQS